MFIWVVMLIMGDQGELSGDIGGLVPNVSLSSLLAYSVSSLGVLNVW